MIDKNYCWKVFKYTKPLQFRTTPVLKDVEGYIVIFMKTKEALVHKSTFSKPPKNLGKLPIPFSGIAYAKITQKVVSQALMTQAITKAPKPDKINF